MYTPEQMKKYIGKLVWVWDIGVKNPHKWATILVNVDSKKDGYYYESSESFWYSHAEPVFSNDLYISLRPKIKFVLKQKKELIQTLLDGGFLPNESGIWRRESNSMDFRPCMFGTCGKEVVFDSQGGYYYDEGDYNYLPEWVDEVVIE